MSFQKGRVGTYESPCYDSLFLVKLKVSTINPSDRVYEGVYSLCPCCSILLLVELHILTMNSSDGVCGRACFYLLDVVVHF